MRVTQMNAFPERENTNNYVAYPTVRKISNPVNNTAKKLSRAFSKFENLTAIKSYPKLRLKCITLQWERHAHIPLRQNDFLPIICCMIRSIKGGIYLITNQNW